MACAPGGRPRVRESAAGRLLAGENQRRSSTSTYAELKELWVPWLGEVAGPWGVRRMKLVLREEDTDASSTTSPSIRWCSRPSRGRVQLNGV